MQLAAPKKLAPCEPGNSMDDLPGMKDGTSFFKIARDDMKSSADIQP